MMAGLAPPRRSHAPFRLVGLNPGRNTSRHAGERVSKSEPISAKLAEFHSNLVSGFGIPERSFGQRGVLGEPHPDTEARQWG